jgi:hypothetical protein
MRYSCVKYTAKPAQATDTPTATLECNEPSNIRMKRYDRIRQPQTQQKVQDHSATATEQQLQSHSNRATAAATVTQ